MKQIWAPWRMQFISGDRPKGCIFCSLPKQKKDRENLIVFRGKKSFVILNKFPYNNGHLMVVPNRHTSEVSGLDPLTWNEMKALLERAMKFLKKTMKAQGFNVGLNLGLAAGAGILDHLHFHLVPRWVGDTNFMPVFTETKVMVENLNQTYDRLWGLFNEGVRRKRLDVRGKK